MERNIHKLMAMSGTISPINEETKRFYHHHHHHRNHPPRKITNVENLDSSPMIMRYLRVGMSPLASIENLQVSPQPLRSPKLFTTLVKVEEDVLVMDGIMVEQEVSNEVRSRGGPLSMSDLGGLSSSDSGGLSSSFGFYRREICRSWEDSGSCRYGAKCQFAHGKEELCPTRFPQKNKSETCKSYSSGSCSYGSKCRFIHHQVNSPASPAESAAMVPFATTQTTTPIKIDQALSNVDSRSTNYTSSDWFPLDDGIDGTLPSSSSAKAAPSREEIDAYINSVLYPTKQSKRLPVFVEICSR